MNRLDYHKDLPFDKICKRFPQADVISITYFCHDPRLSDHDKQNALKGVEERYTEMIARDLEEADLTEQKDEICAKYRDLMTAQLERALANRLVESYAGESFNGSKRYALKKEKGNTVFVIYSDHEELFLP